MTTPTLPPLPDAHKLVWEKASQFYCKHIDEFRMSEEELEKFTSTIYAKARADLLAELAQSAGWNGNIHISTLPKA